MISFVRKFSLRWMGGCIPVLLGVLLLSACAPKDELIRETDEKAYRRGKSLLREGRKDEALQSFIAVIDARRDAAESHLEAGLLYLNHIREPIPAIYHFQRYLAMKPDAEHSGFVKELVITAKKEFARQLPGEPFAPQVERLDLLSNLEKTKAENLELRQQLVDLNAQAQRLASENAQLRQSLGQAQSQAQPGQVAPIVIERSAQRGAQSTPQRAAGGQYTVESGDTLSRISQKVYGTSGRWSEIFEANRDQLPSPNALRPGQVLKIP